MRKSRGYNWCAVILSLGILALLIDPIRFGDLRAHVVRPVSGDRDRTLGSGPFKLNRVDPNTEGHQRPTEVDSRGCWSEAGRAFGTHETGWYESRAKFILVVSGFPTVPGNQLAIEFVTNSGGSKLVPYPAGNPQNTWEPWAVAAPPGAVRFRIRANNAAVGPAAWFAFSEPYTIRMPLDWQALAGLQLICTTCLALALICGPGLVLSARSARNGAARFEASSPSHLRGGDALAPIRKVPTGCSHRDRESPRPVQDRLPPSLSEGGKLVTGWVAAGPLAMAAMGGSCWALGGWISPAVFARVGVGLLLAWLIRALAVCRQKGLALPPGMSATVAAAALIVGFGVAKANISVGPPGELYSGTVSRTLEIGGLSDSRISYHGVQLVAHHFAPFGEQAAAYFGSWSFAARGPLPGLIAAPLVLATGAEVPGEMPDQPWRPFDRQGFATYRIAEITLASLCGWAIFAVATGLMGPNWGTFAVTVGILTPFFVHETYFTWPKLIASAMALLAFWQVHRRQPMRGGLFLGFGYLFHPSVLLMAPFLALWSARNAVSGDLAWHQRLTQPLMFGLAAFVLIVPWQLIGRWAPSGNAQGIFLSYFWGADGEPATWPTWWSSRWQNFANTFIPFHLLSTDPNQDSINSVYAPSPGWVRAAFLWWNTLPFAAGLPAFLLLAAGIARLTRSAARVACVWFYGPAALLVAYWGVSNTGLMRPCGQTFFIAFVMLGVWGVYGADEAWRRKALALFIHPLCFAWRGAEIAAMAFATTILNGFPHPDGLFGVSDLVSLAAALGCLAAAVLILFRQTQADCRDGSEQH